VISTYQHGPLLLQLAANEAKRNQRGGGFRGGSDIVISIYQYGLYAWLNMTRCFFKYILAPTHILMSYYITPHLIVIFLAP